MFEIEYKKDLLQIIKTFNAAISNSQLYSFEHPQVKQYIELTYFELNRILSIRREITLVVIGRNLVFNNQTIQDGGPNIHQFVAILQKHNIERITFLEGLSKEDLYQLIKDLASSETTALKTSEYMKLGKVEIRVEDAELSPDDPISDNTYENLKDILALRDATLAEIKGIYRDIKDRKKQLDIRGVEEMINAFVKGFAHGINPISMLASLKAVDEYTFTHVINVCILTMSQAESLGFSDEHLHQIGVAAVMHDAGKLFIPSEILNKPGKLSMEERAVIETHTTKGARYILELDNMPKIAVLGALEHHIKYDGTGYPSMKGRWNPNIVSQMIAIADVFDAMRSRRSYSEPKSNDQIIQILTKEKGTTFNPFLVDSFTKLIKM